MAGIAFFALLFPCHAQVDDWATRETVALYRNMKRLAPDKMMYGQHQAYFKGLHADGLGQMSDCKVICGSNPAVVGYDFNQNSQWSPTNSAMGFNKQVVAQFRRNGINAFSWHGRNPSPEALDGGGFSDLTGNPVRGILDPASPARAKFNRMLDDVCTFFQNLKTEVYTIRCCEELPDHATGVPGLSFKLLEIANPQTEQGGEVAFAAERFEPIADPALEEAIERNYRIIFEEQGGYRIGPGYVHFGSRNKSGQMNDEDVGFIVGTLVSEGNIVVELLRVEGYYKGTPEQALKVMLFSPSFASEFNAMQHIRVEMGQEAIGLQNMDGLCVRITEDALLCLGPTYVVYGPSAVLKDGIEFDPGELGFFPHKEYWVATNLGEEADEIGNLPRRLREYLDSWEAFTFQPGDDISRGYPGWIDVAVSVDRETFLIWHPNEAVTEASGPYIRILKYR